MARRTTTPTSFHRMTRFALWSLVGIVITGAAVRLTGSGLGCSDWPHCEDNQFVPATDLNAWIEYGNRILSGIVSIAVVIAVLGSRRRLPRRPDLERLSWGLVAGVVAQIILGAITVKVHLAPPFVMAHFLLSMVLIANAVVLERRAQPDLDTSTHVPTPRGLARLGRTTVAVSAVAIFTGTIVTAAGPHGGDENAERLDVALPDAARLHGATVVLLVLCTILLLSRGRREGDAPRVEHIARTGLLVMFAQAGIGYVQYFTGVPAVLVGVHIAGATLLWIVMVRLALAIGEGSPAATCESREIPATVSS